MKFRVYGLLGSSMFGHAGARIRIADLYPGGPRPKEARLRAHRGNPVGAMLWQLVVDWLRCLTLAGILA